MFFQKTEFVNEFIQLIQKCNETILSIYYTDFEVDYKDDESPLTIADKSCNSIICQHLDNLNTKLVENKDVEPNDIVIISEENKNEDYELRKRKKWCWLVDPVDGTKEFVKKNGQFTVNIGLTENGVPVFGIVSIPVTGEIYYGIKEKGSYKFHENNTKTLLVDNDKDYMKKNSRIVASSSHLNKETQDFIDKIEEPIIISTGSSIKLLYIADNKADVYPRIAPTSEWDTCAAHAVVKYAGGKVLNYHSETELQYNKENLLNPYFIVY